MVESDNGDFSMERTGNRQKKVAKEGFATGETFELL